MNFFDSNYKYLLVLLYESLKFEYLFAHRNQIPIDKFNYKVREK